MKISKLGEFGLIERIRRKFESAVKGSIVLGIGDDSAAIRLPDRFILMTTDTMVEGVHFDLDHFSFFNIGWKLAAANLSDIAAMGGQPKYALITLGLNPKIDVADVDGFYRGVKAVFNRHDVSIVGGDIVSSPGKTFFSMGVYGECKKVIKRGGARTGHYIYYIGVLGESAAGLKLLKKGKVPRRARRLVKAHLQPRPLVDEGYALSKVASSMIDNSDGLARCLIEVCRASGVGAEIYEKNIIDPVLKKASRMVNIRPIDLALHGGEDYGLMFTSSKKIRMPGCRLIGKITKEKSICVVGEDGGHRRLYDKGFEHF